MLSCSQRALHTLVCNVLHCWVNQEVNEPFQGHFNKPCLCLIVRVWKMLLFKLLLHRATWFVSQELSSGLHTCVLTAIYFNATYSEHKLGIVLAFAYQFMTNGTDLFTSTNLTGVSSFPVGACRPAFSPDDSDVFLCVCVCFFFSLLNLISQISLPWQIQYVADQLIRWLPRKQLTLSSLC